MAQATTVTPLDHLVKVLKLGEPSAYRNHTYINGESMYFPTGRVYGGQVIAQSVIAASKTVRPSRLPHSVHGYLTSRTFATAARSPLVGSTSPKPRGRFSRPSPLSRRPAKRVWNLPIRCRKTCPIPKR